MWLRMGTDIKHKPSTAPYKGRTRYVPRNTADAPPESEAGTLNKKVWHDRSARLHDGVHRGAFKPFAGGGLYGFRQATDGSCLGAWSS